MNIKITFCSIIMILAINGNLLAQSDNSDHVPGQLIVQLFANNNIDSLIVSFDKRYELKVESCLSKPLSIWLLSFNSNNINEQSLLQKINAHRLTKAVQFNHYVQSRILEPDDPYFTMGNQWDMHNIGQNNGTIDADIDAPEAWELCTGGITAAGDTVVVAVIDGGFDLTHDDLRFWRNGAEIPNNGLDDDNNGYIDDYYGWNAYTNSANITSDQHGTHVSGTVAAIGNNNNGIAGINWNAQVMCVQGSSSNESIVVEAYAYVFQQRKRYNQTQGAEGAFVVATNSSFGINNGNPNNFPIWCSMYDSLGAVGILSAGATANANFNIDVTGDIPTACASEYLITVTNTTRNDEKNTGAAYGLTTIDLGAPGTNVYSTTPNFSYAGLTGTSMATPHVAGAVASMISYACPYFLQLYKSQPDSVALILKQIMMNRVDSLTDLENITVSGGRLNLHKSLLGVAAYCTNTGFNSTKSSSMFQLNVQPVPSNSYLELQYSLPQSENVSIKIYDMSGRLIRNYSKNTMHQGFHSHTINIQDIEQGVYFIQVQVADNYSNTAKFIKKD
ncbi:MAG: S8 family peptidase [Bacteroidia bacterium]|nr:S8 family peptidase [Bacteroidia bacterium]